MCKSLKLRSKVLRDRFLDRGGMLGTEESKEVASHSPWGQGKISVLERAPLALVWTETHRLLSLAREK